MSTRLGGRYQIVRELGAGGMGRVFQAVDTETGRAVAAKILIAASEDNLEALLRFQQEGAVLSTLKHPNIVEVYGTFLEEHTSCIIMELLEGRSLGQILKAERLSLPRIKHLVSQVVSALAYAHGRAIVHRDVKPDNIMVVGNDHVKVTDFGIARILRAGGTLNTATGTSIGTPLYMAPEQIEGQKVDGRADVYSLGAVIYQMVAGKPPFEGDDPLTVAFKHVHKAPQPPSEVNADVPEDWEALILKALSKDPGDRFQTAAAMGEAVNALTTAEGERPHIAPADVGPSPARPDRDTVDRILNPADTAPPLPEMSGGDARTAQPDRPAAAPVQTPPPQPSPFAPAADAGTIIRPAPVVGATDGATVIRPGIPENFDAATVIRPGNGGSAAPADGATDMRPPVDAASPPTVIRQADSAPAFGSTVIQPAVSREPVVSYPQPEPEVAQRPVVTPKRVETTEKKGGPPIAAIGGGIGALVVAAAVIAFFVLHKPSPTPTPTPGKTTAGKTTTGKTTSVKTPATQTGTRSLALAVSGPQNGGAYTSGGAVKLHWNAASGASQYHIQIATAKTDPSDAVVFKHVMKTATTSTTAYSLQVVGPQFYYWRVSPKIAGKWGPFTASQHFAVGRPAVGKPAALAPRNGSSSTAKKIQLCWSSVRGATDYLLRVNGSTQTVHGTCAWLNVAPRAYHWTVAAQVQGAQLVTGTFSRKTFFTVRAPKKKAPAPTATPTPAPAAPAAPSNPAPAPTAPSYSAPAAPAPTSPPPAAPKCNAESC